MANLRDYLTQAASQGDISRVFTVASETKAKRLSAGMRKKKGESDYEFEQRKALPENVERSAPGGRGREDVSAGAYQAGDKPCSSGGRLSIGRQCGETQGKQAPRFRSRRAVEGHRISRSKLARLGSPACAHTYIPQRAVHLLSPDG